MTGICDEGHIVHWRNTRGSRKPQTCAVCGSPVSMARFNPNVPGKYEKANATGRPGTKLLPCVVCGAKRRVPSGNAGYLKEDLIVKFWVPGGGQDTKRVKAGEVVCWHHETASGQYLSTYFERV